MFHDGFFMGGMWFGWIFWIIVIALIVVIFVRLSNQRQNDQRVNTNESPLDVLKKRYAKGEITKEEFDKIKQDL